MGNQINETPHKFGTRSDIEIRETWKKQITNKVGLIKWSKESLLVVVIDLDLFLALECHVVIT
jgi:hypothetical protein